MPKPKYHILVCANTRPPGHPKPSCGSAGSQQLLMAFNMGLMQRGIQPGEVLVTGTGCLGPCEQGPTVVVYPTGTWYFNPFAWQVLFVFGAWCALGGARNNLAIINAPVTLYLCVA